MHVEDKILFNEIKARNLKVYESLFRNYYPILLKFAGGFIFDKQECEDIVQNLFIHFWEHADKISLETSIKAYFFQAVKNRCLNHLRDLQIHDRHNLLYLESLLCQENNEEFPDAEIVSHITAAIAQLPEQMLEIVKLKYLEGKKLSEIAQINKVSKNTVKTQLQRAKVRLRSILTKNTSLKFFLL